MDQQKREVRGYMLSFERLNEHSEIFEHGSFAETIREDFQAGRTKEMFWHRDLVGKVVELREDQQGLFRRSKISETAKGDEYMRLVEDGVLDGASIGFRARETVYSEEDEKKFGQSVRRVRNAQLFECSGVPWGSDQSAFTELSRSLIDLPAADQEHLIRAVLGDDIDGLLMLKRLGELACRELRHRAVSETAAAGEENAVDTEALERLAETLNAQREFLATLKSGAH